MKNSFNSIKEPVLSTFRKVPRGPLKFGNKPMLKRESNITGVIKMWIIVR